MGRLDDRVVIVTCGAAGIGRAFADGFVSEGAKVVLADINGEAAERSAGDIRRDGGDALGLTVDVSKQSDTEFMAQETIKQSTILHMVPDQACFSNQSRLHMLLRMCKKV